MSEQEVFDSLVEYLIEESYADDEYSAWVFDLPSAHKASDHLPVVADIKIYEHNSSRLAELGSGVFNMMEAL